MSCMDLRQGDCVELLRELPDASVDCVLTDPPYASGGICLRDRQRRVSDKYQNSETKKSYPEFFGDAKDQRGWLAWAQLWLAQCWRVARDGAPLLIFSDWRQLPTMTDAIQAAGWSWLGIIPWDKRSSRPQKGRFRQQCEFVIFAGGTRALPPRLLRVLRGQGQVAPDGQACGPAERSAGGDAARLHCAGSVYGGRKHRRGLPGDWPQFHRHGIGSGLLRDQ